MNYTDYEFNSTTTLAPTPTPRVIRNTVLEEIGIVMASGTLCLIIGCLYCSIYAICKGHSRTIIYNQHISYESEETVIDLGEIEKNSNTEEKCTICFEEFKEEDIYKLKCGHKYHIECFKEWSQINPSCPICRYDGK